jgi:hypothetical protein
MTDECSEYPLHTAERSRRLVSLRQSRDGHRRYENDNDTKRQRVSGAYSSPFPGPRLPYGRVLLYATPPCIEHHLVWYWPRGSTGLCSRCSVEAVSFRPRTPFPGPISSRLSPIHLHCAVSQSQFAPKPVQPPSVNCQGSQVQDGVYIHKI